MTSTGTSAIDAKTAVPIGHLPGQEAKAHRLLTRRQRRFAELILQGLTGAEAMRQIGYSGERPERAAWKWLSRSDMKNLLRTRRAEILDAIGIGQEAVLRALLEIAHSDFRALFKADGSMKPVSELDKEQARAIESIHIRERVDAAGRVRLRFYRVRFHDKVRALDLLGQYKGLWGPSLRRCRGEGNKSPASGEVQSRATELRARFEAVTKHEGIA